METKAYKRFRQGSRGQRARGRVVINEADGRKLQLKIHVKG